MPGPAFIPRAAKHRQPSNATSAIEVKKEEEEGEREGKRGVM
jgi:hypothetical protein